MESKNKYGVLGGGAVSGSLIGELASRTHDLGPVSAVSFRVASRIANTLRAGYPVRSADELNTVRTILVYSPPALLNRLLEVLEKAAIDWTKRALVFCDCSVSPETRRRFAEKGASVAVTHVFDVPRRIIVEGEEGIAIPAAHGLARDLALKAVTIAAGAGDRFAAAVTLGSAALTPLLDRTAALLRDAGVRDVEAVRIACSLFEQTARDYAHSGRQSWAWYIRKPEVGRLEAQIAAAEEVGPMLRDLVLFALEIFQKHPEVGQELKRTGDEIASGA